MAKTYKTIAELVKAVKSGELDEDKMEIIMDNDCTHIYYGPIENPEMDDWGPCIFTGKGYEDCADLWPLVFPKAMVDWC